MGFCYVWFVWTGFTSVMVVDNFRILDTTKDDKKKKQWRKHIKKKKKVNSPNVTSAKRQRKLNEENTTPRVKYLF